MNSERVDAVANAIANLGYEGIVAFDRTEPEYGPINTLLETYEKPVYVELLVVLATTVDYQLNGDAQQFWRDLERIAIDYGSLDSLEDVYEILGTFMEADVNARLANQKRDRLVRIHENGFDEWFLENYETASRLEVWKHLATGLNNEMHKKTVVLSMKVFDITRLIRQGKYLDFPSDIPIPCDLQVERVSHSAGLLESDDNERIMAAWADVMERVGERLGEPISILRIDSIVWQAGQIIGEHEPNRPAARRALVEHFSNVGIEDRAAQTLADELTAEM